MYKRLHIVLLLIMLVYFLQAQNPDFRNPLDYRMYLSGTFAELRGNHFHSGIDIKTRQTTGHPIHAIGDGYISRIKVRAYGFGHALYITHPSGHTSVYGHLKSFNNKISKDVMEKQYGRKSFKVNYYPSKDRFPVKKGDVIGYSGNSGSSGGPHLHFEIRQANNQKPSNALSYGYDVADNIAPFVKRIRFFPVGENSAVNGGINPQSMYIFKRGKNIKPNTSNVKVFGSIALGIQTYDKLNGASNHNGPYRVAMFADSVKFWEFKADKFSFAETRYINAMIDYASYVSNGHKYYQSYMKPNNELSLLEARDNGLVHFQPGEKRKIRIEVEDYAGNLSQVKFVLQAARSDPGVERKLKGELFRENKMNRFVRQDIRLNIPAAALYDTLDFWYEKEDMSDYGYSYIHRVHNSRTPLHKHATLSVRVERMVNNNLKNKLVLARLDDIGRKHVEGGEWDDGWITTKTRQLGRYVVIADTVDPKIKPLNFYPGKSVSKSGSIDFTITDELAGIDYYRGEIDGKWVLFKYFPNRNRLTYEIDKHVGSGKHQLHLKVVDENGNMNVYRASFLIP